ncbi:hypothetical protein ACN9MB_09070 [Dyella kyungheensis]|uniref:hypothetical protein n=1 Tax=Dyella kyungheensis TaxID=1242174 RepID=UPI003CECF2DE
MDDHRIYLDDQAKRQAIRSGWEGFQCYGWKAKAPFTTQDDRWWYWMNGMEGAEKNYKGYSIRIEDVDGWKTKH